MKESDALRMGGQTRGVLLDIHMKRETQHLGIGWLDFFYLVFLCFWSSWLAMVLFVSLFFHVSILHVSSAVFRCLPFCGIKLTVLFCGFVRLIGGKGRDGDVRYTGVGGWFVRLGMDGVGGGSDDSGSLGFCGRIRILCMVMDVINHRFQHS